MSFQKETLHIDGMSCNHCVSSVTNALKATDGVEVEHVEIGKAEVNYNPTQTSPEKLAEVIEEIGFQVKSGN